MNNIAEFPKPVKCHNCEHSYVGTVCALCGEERPAYTAMKRITARAHHGIEPLRNPDACIYFPNSLCGCGGRGTCLEVA